MALGRGRYSRCPDNFGSESFETFGGYDIQLEKEWKEVADKAKPEFMNSAVWKGLVDYWRYPHATQVARNCSKSCMTDQDGAGGTFVNPRAEQIAYAHDAIAAQHLSHMSTSPDGLRSTPSTAETYRLPQELAEARSKIETLQNNDNQRWNELRSITELLKFVAMDSPHHAEALCARSIAASGPHPFQITPEEAHAATDELGRDCGTNDLDEDM
ncbi:unnamed protein product [Cochlearia groenlandica]